MLYSQLCLESSLLSTDRLPLCSSLPRTLHGLGLTPMSEGDTVRRSDFMACAKRNTLSSCPRVGAVLGTAKDEEASGMEDVMSHHGVVSQRLTRTNAAELPRILIREIQILSVDFVT